MPWRADDRRGAIDDLGVEAWSLPLLGWRNDRRLLMLSCYAIVAIALPCSDGPQAKPWSALVISTFARSWKVMLAFISSNISEHPVI